jgi:hypothetical protein
MVSLIGGNPVNSTVVGCFFWKSVNRDKRNFVNHIIVMIAVALFCAAVPAQAQTSIKPASIYDQDGITVVSPNQFGWALSRTNKPETVFEKRDEGGILNASVKTIRTRTFETDKDRLAGWKLLNKKNSLN